MPPWEIADVPYISYLLSGLSWETYFIHVCFSFDCEKQTYGMHFYWEWKNSSTAKLAAAHYSTRLLKNRRRDLIGCLFDNDLRWPLWKCADCENHCFQHEASITSLQQNSYLKHCTPSQAHSATTYSICVWTDMDRKCNFIGLQRCKTAKWSF